MVRFKDRLSTASDADLVRWGAMVVLAVIVLGASFALLAEPPYRLQAQPFPDAHEYLDATNRLAHGHGYTTTVRDSPSPHLRQAVNPPRFPPGTSLVLVPFALIGHYPGNIEFGSRVLVVVMVLSAAWAAFALAGLWAALLTALLVASSHFAIDNTHVVMSDALAASLAILVVPLLRRRTLWAVYVAGFIAGYGFVVRESAIAVVAALVITVSGWDRLRVAVTAVVPITGLGIYNWATFGAPWSSGQGYWLGRGQIYSSSFILRNPWTIGRSIYNAQLRVFHLVAHTGASTISTLPNAVFYPLLVLGLGGIFAPVFVGGLGLVAAVWWRREREAHYTLIFIILSLLAYLPNRGQNPRYMAGPCILLVVWAAVGAIRVGRWAWANREARREASASAAEVL